MFWPPQGYFPGWGAGGPEPQRPREEPSPLRQIANARAELRFNSENGALEVYDSVTRCTWKQAVGDANFRASHVEVQEDPQGKRIKAELLGPVPCLVTVDLIHEQQADVLVTITPKNVLSGEEDDALVIPYPYPFQAAANSRLALPTQPRETFVGAKGSWNRPDWFVVAKDLTAPWFGCAAPAGGYVGVVQEPAGWQCALQVIHPTAAKGDKGASPCYTVRPVWRHASGDLVAELRILYHFSSVATYAGLSQAYEEVEKRMGIFAMLEEN
jgi:hypothetical protein